MSDARYASTATGELGVHRKSMLYNPLLFGTELGKSISRGYNKKFAGNAAVYGKVEKKEPQAMVDVFNWNPANVQRPSTSASRRPKTASSCSTVVRQGSMAGSHSRPSTSDRVSLKDLIEHRCQREWIEMRLQRKKVVQKVPQHVYKDNYTSVLRQRLLSMSVGSERGTGQWRMSKFTNVQPRVQTYLRPVERSGRSSPTPLATDKK